MLSAGVHPLKGIRCAKLKLYGTANGLKKGIRFAKLKLYGTANGLKKGIRFANAILVTPPRPSPQGEGA